MSVTLDATVSGAAANSYVATIDDALVLMDASPYLAAFVKRSEEEDESANTQTRLLLRAMDVLDTLGFPGYATETSQALQFPRSNVTHPSGWMWDAFAVPTPMKRAQALLAAWLAAQTTADPQVNASASGQELKSLTVGPIDLEFATTAATAADSGTPLDDYLDRVIVPMLAAQGLLAGDDGTVRLVR